MDQQRTVHITWNEARRAEAEREKLKEARCTSIPVPNRLKVMAAHLFKDLPKLKAAALRLLSVKPH